MIVAHGEGFTEQPDGRLLLVVGSSGNVMVYEFSYAEQYGHLTGTNEQAAYDFELHREAYEKAWGL